MEQHSLGTAEVCIEVLPGDRADIFDMLSAIHDLNYVYAYPAAEESIGAYLKSNGRRARVVTTIPKYTEGSFIDHCKGMATASMRKVGRNNLWGILIDPQDARDRAEDVLGLRAWFLATGVGQKFGVSLGSPEDLSHQMMGLYEFTWSEAFKEFQSFMFWGGNIMLVRGADESVNEKTRNWIELR